MAIWPLEPIGEIDDVRQLVCATCYSLDWMRMDGEYSCAVCDEARFFDSNAASSGIPQALDLGVCSHEAAFADVTASTTCSTVVPNTMHSYEPNYEAGSEKQAESEQLTDDPGVNPETMSVRPSWHERRRAR